MSQQRTIVNLDLTLSELIKPFLHLLVHHFSCTGLQNSHFGTTMIDFNSFEAAVVAAAAWTSYS